MVSQVTSQKFKCLVISETGVYWRQTVMTLVKISSAQISVKLVLVVIFISFNTPEKKKICKKW